MNSRCLAIFVATLFLACQVAACACRASRSEAPEKKSAKKSGCCSHKEAPAPKAPEPPKDCCCSDGSHLAVADEVTSTNSQIESAAPVVHAQPRITAPGAAVGFGTPPRDRASTVPLYTLHGALLI